MILNLLYCVVGFNSFLYVIMASYLIGFINNIFEYNIIQIFSHPKMKFWIWRQSDFPEGLRPLAELETTMAVADIW